MKKIFFILFLLSTFTLKAQFAIINDKEGFCNVRSSAVITNNVIDRLPNGTLLYSLDKENNFADIDYIKNKVIKNGYLYNNRLLMIDSFTTIPETYRKDSNIVFKRDSIEVIITEKSFDPSKHKLGFYNGNKDQLELIDDQPFWGTDGGFPNSAYHSINIRKGKWEISLPSTSLKDLFQINLYNTRVNYDAANDIVYIHAINSDGAGGYVVLWKIEKGVYKERLVLNGF